MSSYTCRCIDYVFYYPNQAIPESGACGFQACDGSMKEYMALEDDSDFSRSFGITTQCEEDDSVQNKVGNSM